MTGPLRDTKLSGALRARATGPYRAMLFPRHRRRIDARRTNTLLGRTCPALRLRRIWICYQVAWVSRCRSGAMEQWGRGSVRSEQDRGSVRVGSSGSGLRHPTSVDVVHRRLQIYLTLVERCHTNAINLDTTINDRCWKFIVVREIHAGFPSLDQIFHRPRFPSRQRPELRGRQTTPKKLTGAR